jgi:hypothetical protein
MLTLALLCGCDHYARPSDGFNQLLLSATITGVSVTPAGPTTLKVGDQITLFAAVSATAGAVTSYGSYWSTSDPNVANVSRTPIGTTQVISANSPGTVSIIAASEMNPSVTGTATIRVIDR